MKCPYESLCSGCDLLHLSSTQQQEHKVQGFQDLNPRFVSFGENQLRSRLDFIISSGKMGLYQKNSKEIVDIEHCLQLEPDLQSFYSDFRKILFPIQKGSVRLRVSPSGKRGAWLDFSNLDIKALLDSKDSLLQLQEMAFVEIGQRHKSLIHKDASTLGLGDPVLNPWFQTFMGDQAIPLYSTVASFTQPSHVANKGITQTLSKWFAEMKPDHVLEFGSGIGNLTFPALTALNTQVTATDIDERALNGLKKSLEQTNLQSRVNIQCGDFRIKMPKIKDVDVLLLNPARSGVGQFLNQLLPLKPKYIVYMSCFEESYRLDTQNLTDYSLQKIELVDQFPNTKHVEILSYWVKN